MRLHDNNMRSANNQWITIEYGYYNLQVKSSSVSTYFLHHRGHERLSIFTENCTYTWCLPILNEMFMISTWPVSDSFITS